jgi:hypothetical protein
MLPSSSDSSASEDSDRGHSQKRSSNKEAADDKVLEKSPKGRFYRVREARQYYAFPTYIINRSSIENFAPVHTRQCI